MSRYKITSIEKVSPPQGASSKCWYKFIIQNEANTITSMRSGSQKEIMQFANESVKRLNEKYLTHIDFKLLKPVNEVSLSNHHLYS